MPKMRYQSNVGWMNYHKTIGVFEPMTIESLASIDATDAVQASGLERFAATATTLFGHLRTLEQQLEATGRPFAAGLVGSAWSFAPLIGTPVSQLLCGGLSGTTGLAADEHHAACPAPASYIALAGGGTTMHDIAQWAESRGRTFRTSGSFLGPTIAGGVATASHGSRLGYGGIQNMVLGLHLIVGSGEHVWIERKSCPVLSQTGLDRLAAGGVPVRFVSDDDQFEDVLVHLGAMGIVNGVALELTDNRRFALMERMEVLTPAWLEVVASGDFRRIAARLGCSAEPTFYELTLNPHGPFADAATHTMYFPTDRAQSAPAEPARVVHAGGAIAKLGSTLDRARPADVELRAELRASREPLAVPRWVLRWLLEGADSVFSYYFRDKDPETTDEPFDPEDTRRKAFTWSQLHQGEGTGGPAALYNASFSVPLDRVTEAVPAICAAVEHLSPSFVFTLRFVCKAAGTLAFTRFDENAVIEIDGLSQLLCLSKKSDVPPDHPNAKVLLAALDELSVTVRAGAAAVRTALDGAGVPYSMHWAKLGDLDQAKVYADYGHPRDPESLIRRWRETRDALLSPFGRKIFWNDAVVSYGLLDEVKSTGAQG